MRLGDDRQVCHRLLQRLAFSETRHNWDIFPTNTMAYDRYKAYVSNFLMLEEPESFIVKKFRERVRLPHPNFLQLVVSVSESELFDRWCGHKRNNKQASPIELLVLGSLQYLGCGWAFDDIEENTAVSKEVHRTFFHLFVEFGSTVLYEQYVLTPVFVNKAKTHMGEFEEAGFPGCVGSSDATHND